MPHARECSKENHIKKRIACVFISSLIGNRLYYPSSVNVRSYLQCHPNARPIFNFRSNEILRNMRQGIGITNGTATDAKYALAELFINLLEGHEELYFQSLKLHFSALPIEGIVRKQCHYVSGEGMRLQGCRHLSQWQQ